MYTIGTMRIKHPSETIAGIALYTSELGITRCQNVTDFDRIGIPVFSAITPANPAFQAAWGKGCTDQNAQASALMAAVERSFIEERHPHERRMSQFELKNTGHNFLQGKDLPTYKHGIYCNDSRIIAWVPMYDFLQHTTCWVPASALYYTKPMLTAFTANGLSSGNSSEEAMLHGLLEVFERHAISSMYIDGRLRLKESGGKRILLTGGATSVVTEILDKLRAAKVELLLFSIPSPVSAIKVYWAVLYDTLTKHKHVAISMGYGAHSSPDFAITQAVTEAAKNRVTILHGCNEDKCKTTATSPSQQTLDRTIEYFRSIPETIALGDIPIYRPLSITNELAYLFSNIREAGYRSLLSIEIPHSVPSVSIRRTIVPSTALHPKLF